MTKSFYILSAIALINFIATVVVINAPDVFIKTSNEPQPTPTPIVITKKIIKRVEVAATNNPTLSTTHTPNPLIPQPTPAIATTQPTKVAGCVITIDSNKYDVTSFKSQHSGGDIFNCGSDMSSAFWRKHGQFELNEMQKYKI